VSKKTIAGALGLALVLVLLPATLSFAEYRGTDMWSNLAPSGPGGLADQHPLSYYSLDYHVDGPSVGLGGASTGDIPALVAQFFSMVIFMFFTFLMRVTIYAFDWSFNIDIIGGQNGALQPVGAATQHLYSSTFVPLITSAVLIFGGWMLYKTINRKFGEAGAGFVRTICLTTAALVIIFNPGTTIGKASSLSKQLSGSIVSGTTGGNGGQDVSDRLFDTFIYKPWAVLQFGGLKRCVSAERDADGFPKPVSNDDPHRVICRNVLKADAAGHGGYAPKFAALASGSSERKDLYENIKDGKAPYDKADAPAVDMMQAGGAVQRLVYVALLSIGIIAAILLLGLLCFASLFAQLGLLVMLAMTPAMVIVGIFPGLHGVFWSWAKLGGKLLIAIVVFSLLLSAAMGVSAALMASGDTMGYLPAFVLQTVLFLGLFIKRKALADVVTSRREYSRSESNTRSFVAGTASAAVGAVASPVAAAAMAKDKISNRQEAAPNPGTSKPGEREQPSDEPVSVSRVPVDSSSPPASAGRDYSPNPPSTPENLPITSNSDQVKRWNGTSTKVEPGGEPMPTKSFREELEIERVERANGNHKAPAPPSTGISNQPLSTSFPEALKQARADQEKARSPE